MASDTSLLAGLSLALGNRRIRAPQPWPQPRGRKVYLCPRSLDLRRDDCCCDDAGRSLLASDGLPRWLWQLQTGKELVADCWRPLHYCLSSSLGSRAHCDHGGLLLWLLSDLGCIPFALGMASIREAYLRCVLATPSCNQAACCEHGQLLPLLTERSDLTCTLPFGFIVRCSRGDVVPCREAVCNIG